MGRFSVVQEESASSHEAVSAPRWIGSPPTHQTATGRPLVLLGRSERICYFSRAIALWPRLDHRALRRVDHDPRRMAVLIARRTSLPLETIVTMLTRGDQN